MPISYQLSNRFPVEVLPGVETSPWPHVFYYFRLGDVNDDGEYEIILNRGAMGQAVYTLSGDLLWEYRDPSAGWEVIRPDSPVFALDIDGDGHTEVLGARYLEGELKLCVLDGGTGEIKHAARYPGFDPDHKERSSIVAFKSTPGMRGFDIAVAWDYKHLDAVDCSLKPLWHQDTPTEKFGSGHTLAAYDIDGDGADELFWGCALFNSDGTVIWNRTDLLSYAKDTHNDCTRIGDIDGDGEPELFLSSGGYLLNAQGQIRWSIVDKFRNNECGHGQFVRLAKLRPNVPGLDIVFIDLPAYCEHADLSKFEELNLVLTPSKSEPFKTFYASHVYIFDSTGGELARMHSIHDVLIGDMDGDGLDEIAALAPDGERILFLKFIGEKLCEVDSIPFSGKDYPQIDRHISDARLFDIDQDGCCELIQVRRESGTAYMEIHRNVSGKQKAARPKGRPLNTQILANFTAY